MLRLVGLFASAALSLGGGVAKGVSARPVLTGGTATFLALFGLVATNALVSQTTRHPQPLLATRGEPVSARTEVADAATAAAAVWRPTNDPRIMTVPLVRDVQELLKEAGLYEAEIDGRPGQATDRAIRRFQAERGLRVDGMATPFLLTQIRQMTGDVPSPDERPSEDDVASLIADLGAGPRPDPAVTSDRELVRDIQAELANASVAQLTADGILGERTRAAIRTFQALEGMDVTGEPSEPLLTRLRQMASNG